MTVRSRRAARLAVLLAAVVSAAVAAAGCGGVTPSRPPPAAASPPPGSAVVNTVGSGYAEPVFQEIGSRVSSGSVTVNYQLDGSSDPARELRDPLAALAASQSSRPFENLPRLRGTSTLYIPVAFGAVAVVYDLPGVRRALRLRPSVLAGIFLGRIRDWNDRRIRAGNRGVRLPAQPITVLHRSDPAVATELFSEYLSAVSGQWRRKIAAGPTVAWPTGVAEPAQDTLLTTLAQTPGSIGYVDQATALQDGLKVAELRNRAGRYVAPTLGSTAAVALQHLPAGQLSMRTIDVPVAGAYPIATEAYLMALRDPCDGGLTPAQALGVRRELDYALGPGQDVVSRFSFAPLPRGLLSSARRQVRQLRCSS